MLLHAKGEMNENQEPLSFCSQHMEYFFRSHQSDHVLSMRYLHEWNHMAASICGLRTVPSSKDPALAQAVPPGPAKCQSAMLRGTMKGNSSLGTNGIGKIDV